MAFDAENIERGNRHRHGFQVHILPVASEIVGFLTVDFLGRVGARHLHDAAGERSRRRDDIGIRKRRKPCKNHVPLVIGLFEEFAVSVVRRGGLAETDHRLIGFVDSHDVAEQPGGAAKPHDEQSCRHGVEGARVAHMLGMQGCPRGGHDVVAGYSARFIHCKKARGEHGFRMCNLSHACSAISALHRRIIGSGSSACASVHVVGVIIHVIITVDERFGFGIVIIEAVACVIVGGIGVDVIFSIGLVVGIAILVIMVMTVGIGVPGI